MAAIPFSVHADEAADEIIGRYNTSLDKAKLFCPGLSEKIDFVKTMAGIGIGTGVGGTVAGGVATGAGFWKLHNDDVVGATKMMTKMEETRAKIDANVNSTSNAEDDEFIKNALGLANNKSKLPKPAKDLKKAEELSRGLGYVRTGGAFVAGATGLGGAISAKFGTDTLDKLIADMNACDSYVREIEKQKDELTFTAPDNPTLAQMNKIVNSCKGMNSKNIAEVKNNLKTAGIISAIGAAAGIVGGGASIVADKMEHPSAPKEKKDTTKQETAPAAQTPPATTTPTKTPAAPSDKDIKGWNMAANISSGVAALAGLGGAIFSGATLSGLNKNSDTAAKCKEAF